MAQASEDAQNQQPGAADVVDDGNKEQDKEKELEEMKKLLAAKDAEIAALKAQNETSSDDKSTADGGGDNDESKAPPKTDVCHAHHDPATFLPVPIVSIVDISDPKNV